MHAASLSSSENTPIREDIPPSVIPIGSVMVYFWKKRAAFLMACRRVEFGHIALAINIPDNWYQHTIFLSKPTEQDVDGPSYNLYQDEDDHWKVFIVHVAGVTELVDLSKKDDKHNRLYETEVGEFLYQFSRQQAAFTFNRFPDLLVTCIASYSRYQHADHVFYVSFSPETSITTGTQLWSTSGEFLDQKQERAAYGEPDAVVTLCSLDNAAIYQAAIKLRDRVFQSSIQSLEQRDLSEAVRWGLRPTDYTCSSTGYSLLEEGSIKKRLPAFGRLGTFQHIILLSFRPAFALASLLPLYYFVIFTDERVLSLNSGSMQHFHHGESHHTLYQGLFVLTISLQLAVLSIFDKYGIAYFPALRESAYRGRELVEIHGAADLLVQIIAFISVAVSGLVFDVGVFEKYVSDQANNSLLFSGDVLLSALSASLVYLITAFVSSSLLACCQGRQIKTPQALYRLTACVESMDAIPEPVLRCQFKKEWSLGVMNLLTLLANFTMIRYVDQVIEHYRRSPVFLLSSFSLFFSGYLLSKGLIMYFDKQQQKALLQEPSSALGRVQLASHNPRPALFALTAFLCSASMLISAETLAGQLDPLIVMLITAGMGLLAYWVAAGIHHVGYISSKHCASSFFALSRKEQASIQPISEETPLLAS